MPPEAYLYNVALVALALTNPTIEVIAVAARPDAATDIAFELAEPATDVKGNPLITNGPTGEDTERTFNNPVNVTNLPIFVYRNVLNDSFNVIVPEVSGVIVMVQVPSS